MVFISLLLIQASHAVVVNTGECITTSFKTKQCCDDPIAEACLDAEARALNEKVKSAQESISRRSSGVHDVTVENKARADLMHANAQLNLRSAAHCEQLTKECLAKCENLNSSDAKLALGRCQVTGKIIEALREQAARDEASAKRMARAK